MKLLLIALMLVIAGCCSGCDIDYSPKEYNYNGHLPKDLADCKVYRINGPDAPNVLVVRCPNSSTTTRYQEGKATRTTVVIDGVEYVQKE